MSENKKVIGWIGTGIMGKSQALHLIANGYKLNVFNRTESKTKDLTDKGAIYMSANEVAQKSDYVFLMLGYPSDVKELVLGENGILKDLKEGSILIDHTTSSPSLAQEIYNKCKEKKVASIDAPVSGGDIGAKNGQLVCFCGGDQEAFNEVKPVFENYSKEVQLFGAAGTGQHCKMANQVVIAGAMVGVCEGLIYAYKSGINVENCVNIIKGGAAGSKTLELYGNRLLKKDYEPGFYVKHYVKDLGIALEECEKMGIKLPGLKLVSELYQELMKTEKEQNLGTQALITVLEKMNKIEQKE